MSNMHTRPDVPQPARAERHLTLQVVERRVLWPATAMIDHANNKRVTDSGLGAPTSPARGTGSATQHCWTRSSWPSWPPAFARPCFGSRSGCPRCRRSRTRPALNLMDPLPK